MENKFSFRARLRSFGYAFSGIVVMFKEEHNAWIHLFATCCVVVIASILGCSVGEWVALVFAIGFVIVSEAINSAIERLCDHISPDYNAAIGVVKDLASAAVLISAITAAVVGLLVFAPKVF